MHLLYHAQTRGVFFSHVVLVGDGAGEYDIFRSYRNKNGFELHFVPDANSVECETVLRGIQPDIMAIKTGGTILEERIIEIPSVATINVHPSLLPNYRGIDAEYWALLHDDAVGSSAHVVDIGVDTGDLIAQRKLDEDSADSAGEIIEQNYYETTHQVMVDAILRYEDESAEPEPQDTTEGKQYFSMHEKLRDIVDELVQQKR
ncbi:formyltransferase family protein [Haloarchaeobius litoreus]|uniref:phosphoribosylglycinamide formyltransferase 1 n=1 Tax=Haloarchaeobius litoreus TaxID=755306 RepID=A0ABD6DIE0_9EURY|nr:formyltransferase family protein [Haloarchaeobius litoreus]